MITSCIFSNMSFSFRKDTMKYIIADASGSMADIVYKDLENNTDFIIYNKERLGLFFRVFLSRRIKKIRALKPIKNLLYKKLFFLDDDSGEGTCYYFGVFWYDDDLFEMLKKRYPDARMIFNFHDTVESKRKLIKGFSIEALKRVFDLVCSYSVIDANRYGLYYVPDMYSRLPLKDLPHYQEYDVVFIGAAKDRLQTIISVFDRLSSFGLKCWFYIVGAKRNERCFRKGITYSNKYLSFEEVIARQASARCLLEITQQGSTDTTLRFWDAVLYNKKIITNCQSVKNYSYFNTQYVLLFQNINDISKDFFSSSSVDFYYKGDVSPLTIFKQMEEQLGANNNEISQN